MREIKFRGKSTTKFDDKNIWIYGDLLQPTEICYIYEISDCNSIDGSRYEVNENTIGQYTGLKDKNGKEIYEGDVVHLLGGICEQGFYEIDIKNKIDNFIEDTYFLTEALNQGATLEVIGNIYDNPELVKE